MWQKQCGQAGGFAEEALKVRRRGALDLTTTVAQPLSSCSSCPSAQRTPRMEDTSVRPLQEGLVEWTGREGVACPELVSMGSGSDPGPPRFSDLTRRGIKIADPQPPGLLSILVGPAV